MLLTLTIYRQPDADQGLLSQGGGRSRRPPLQTFLHVTLPLSLPGVAVGAFLTFVLAIGDYITPQILGGGKRAAAAAGDHAADRPRAPISRWPRRFSMILMLVVTVAYLLFARCLRMERV